MSEVLAIIGIVVGGVVLFLAGIFWMIALLAFPGDLAQIEQLRQDTTNVQVLASEDVIGQVTQWNQTIRSNQTYDRMFLIGILIPDQWQDVALIEIPR